MTWPTKWELSPADLSSPPTSHHLPNTLKQTASYLFAKACLYTVMVLRLNKIYKDTVYAYPIKLTHSFVALIFFYTTIMTPIIFMEVEGTEYSVGEDINSRRCETRIPFWVLAIQTTTDLLISSFTMYLFLYPLKKMLTKQQTHAQFTSHPLRPLPSLFLSLSPSFF